MFIFYEWHSNSLARWWNLHGYCRFYYSTNRTNISSIDFEWICLTNFLRVVFFFSTWMKTIILIKIIQISHIGSKENLEFFVLILFQLIGYHWSKKKNSTFHRLLIRRSINLFIGKCLNSESNDTSIELKFEFYFSFFIFFIIHLKSMANKIFLFFQNFCIISCICFDN